MLGFQACLLCSSCLQLCCSQFWLDRCFCYHCHYTAAHNNFSFFFFHLLPEGDYLPPFVLQHPVKHCITELFRSMYCLWLDSYLNMLLGYRYAFLTQTCPFIGEHWLTWVLQFAAACWKQCFEVPPFTVSWCWQMLSLRCSLVPFNKGNNILLVSYPACTSHCVC